jgi:hypothetical protein
MAEATDTLHLAQLRTRLHCPTNTRARQIALDLTKRQLAAQGFRVSSFSHRELVAKAEAYLAQHREELIAEAKETVERWRVEGFFGKRARAAVHRTTNLRTVPRPKEPSQWRIHHSRRSRQPLNRTVRRPNAELRTREHLTADEVERLIAEATANRQGHRDALMILLAFRLRGLRSSVGASGLQGCDLACSPDQERHPRHASANWPRVAGLAPTSTRGCARGVCVRVGEGCAALRPRLLTNGRTRWAGREAGDQGPRSYASACMWLCAGERRARYPRPASLPRARKYPEHDALHSLGGGTVQGVLAGLARGTFSSPQVLWS